MRFFDKELLPFGHVVDQGDSRQVFVYHFETVMLKETRYDSMYVSSGLQGGIGQYAHRAATGTPVNQTVAVLADPLP